jgi:hypothetical protein
MSEIKTAHYTNFGRRIQPRCADALGYLHYRVGFQLNIPEEEWTDAERYIDDAERAIARWNEQRS